MLDNAMKYGGNLIHVGIKTQGDHVIITVADNGPGIPAEYHKKIFENFFRIPSDNRHDVKGHGLGLSYARDIIIAHVGTLEMESRSGDGVAFIITLPINPLLS
jgi:two-component system phosphate regulon sensor histidine kinase PhoR